MTSVQNYIREEITVISVNKSTQMVHMIKMKLDGYSVMAVKNGITLIVKQNIEILIFVMKLITSLITVSLV